MTFKGETIYCTQKYIKYNNKYTRGQWWRSWLKHCATSRNILYWDQCLGHKRAFSH